MLTKKCAVNNMRIRRAEIPFEDMPVFRPRGFLGLDSDDSDDSTLDDSEVTRVPPPIPVPLPREIGPPAVRLFMGVYGSINDDGRVAIEDNNPIVMDVAVHQAVDHDQDAYILIAQPRVPHNEDANGDFNVVLHHNYPNQAYGVMDVYMSICEPDVDEIHVIDVPGHNLGEGAGSTLDNANYETDDLLGEEVNIDVANNMVNILPVINEKLEVMEEERSVHDDDEAPVQSEDSDSDNDGNAPRDNNQGGEHNASGGGVIEEGVDGGDENGRGNNDDDDDDDDNDGNDGDDDKEEGEDDSDGDDSDDDDDDDDDDEQFDAMYYENRMFQTLRDHAHTEYRRSVLEAQVQNGVVHQHRLLFLQRQRQRNQNAPAGPAQPTLRAHTSDNNAQ